MTSATRTLPVRIAPLAADDRAAWELLARAYKNFYATATTDAQYAAAWQRLLLQDGVHGLAAFADGRLVGIAHYLFHTGVWARTSCYAGLSPVAGAGPAGISRGRRQPEGHSRVHGVPAAVHPGRSTDRAATRAARRDFLMLEAAALAAYACMGAHLRRWFVEARGRRPFNRICSALLAAAGCGLLFSRRAS